MASIKKQSTGTGAQGKLGTKHVCGHCSTRFYDMNKADARCPKCETSLEAMPRPGTSAVADKILQQPKAKRGDEVIHLAEAHHHDEDFADVGNDLVAGTARAEEENYDSMIGGNNHLFDNVEELERGY